MHCYVGPSDVVKGKILEQGGAIRYRWPYTPHISGTAVFFSREMFFPTCATSINNIFFPFKELQVPFKRWLNYTGKNK